MTSYILTPIKIAKSFVVSNKRLFLVCLIIILSGVGLGAYLVLTGGMADVMYAREVLDLPDVILGDVGFWGLLFSNIKSLILPLVIIFIMCTNRFTAGLSYFYLFYQSVLLGASVVGVVSETGLGGVLVALFLIIPINLANFSVITSWVVVCYKRMKLSRLEHLKLMPSLRVFSKNILGVVVAACLASVVYSVLYPLLLRSMVVVMV